MMEKLNQTILSPFRVLCIDDGDKPSDIEDSEWVVAGKEEIVVNIYSDLLGGEEAYQLLGKNPLPYRGYTKKRFVIVNNHSVN